MATWLKVLYMFDVSFMVLTLDEIGAKSAECYEKDIISYIIYERVRDWKYRVSQVKVSESKQVLR